MRRIIALFMALLTIAACLCALTACAPSLEACDYAWRAETVRSSVVGDVIYYDPQSGSAEDYPYASPIVLKCAVRGEKMILSDESGNRNYEGKCVLVGRADDACEYEITFGGVRGSALVSLVGTTEGDVVQLTVSIGEYIMNFFA